MWYDNNNKYNKYPNANEGAIYSFPLFKIIIIITIIIIYIQVLILFYNWGISGAAVATTTAQFVACIALLQLLERNDKEIIPKVSEREN